MLRDKNVTLTFLLAKDVSLMIQNYFFPQLSLVEQIIIRRLGIRKLITKNSTDSIIAITWDSIKCEGERQKHPRYIIVSRVFRFLSPTKLNRYEQAVYSAAHTIQPLCLEGA